MASKKNFDDVSDFFNFTNGPKPRIVLNEPKTAITVKVDERDWEDIYQTEKDHKRLKGTDYATYYKELEAQNVLEQLATIEDKNPEMLDDLTSVGDINRVTDLIEDTQFYKKYYLQPNKKQNFTIDSKKTEILENINSHPVLIIDGPTGCGKTTQVPQWILEDHFKRQQYCNIVVTQPRRIAAISIARRVCEENNLEIGGIVGYQVGLDGKTSCDTRLQYVTTGVLLQRFVATRSMEKFTHIILDEVHERNQTMDFLLIVVKKLMLMNRHVKIIVMSATFNVDAFSSFFCFPTYHGAEKHPVIKIDSRRVFDVKIFYLGALSVLGQVPEIKTSDPKISKEMYIFTLKILNAFEYIDESEEANKECNNSRPSVLIFLPGIYEIEELYNTLNNHALRMDVNPKWAACKWLLIPLHSTITTEEQVRVFCSPPAGHRKIILATNIAESSITVPDIKYVVDFCLTKVLITDESTNFSSLKMVWASQANCKQRSGRAGRVREGRVYRMVEQEFFAKLSKDCDPEMKRCPLNSLVLSAKLLDMGSPVSILALAMDPPDLSHIDKTVINLKMVGALFSTVSGNLSKDDGDITYLGRIMAKLPVDIRISKLIALGYIFGCLDDCIIMGSAMSVKNIFSTPFQERLLAYNSKLTWADGSASDCLTFLNVYKVYQHMKRQNILATIKDEKEWARPLFLQINALRELDCLVKELKHRLIHENIVEYPGKNELWNEIEIPLILKLLLAGAFYPYYFAFSHPGEEGEREATKLLSGRDPRNTIYLTHMDQHQPGPLYTGSIKKLLQPCSNEEIVVSFDNTTSKVFVTFPNREMMSKRKGMSSMIPGKVALPVYKAVKMRHLKIPMNLKVLPVKKAVERAIKLGICKSKGHHEWELVTKDEPTYNFMYPKLPDIDENYVDVIISHMINCGHFWCQYADDTSTKQLNWLYNLMKNKLVPLKDRPQVGALCAAPFQENDKEPLAYYRAKIEKILPNNLVWVFYIDFGNNAHVPLNSLKDFGSYTENVTAIQAKAFECVLTEVTPSIIKDQRAIWTRAAIGKFINLTRGKKLLAKVFSVALGVVSLELFIGEKSINEILIDEGFAQPSEESYMSKINRDIRDTARELQPIQKNALNKLQTKEFSTVSQSGNTIDPPPISECTMEVKLKGPFSPLETKLHSLMEAGRTLSINVEWNSVNSIVLNTDPQNYNERLLIAACVDQSAAGSGLILRHTTLMPNIPGLPALVALIFCPMAELRPDMTKCHYAAVLCGQGSDETGRPLHGSHDMLVPIDVELSNKDITSINQLRYYMDLMLLTQPGQETPMNSEEVKCETMEKIKLVVQNLISTPRRLKEVGEIERGWHWNTRYPEMEAEAINHLGDRAIFPPHSGLILLETPPEELMKLAESNQKVISMCQSTLLSGNHKVACNLCDTQPLVLTSMRIHLNSRMHKEREKDLPRLPNSTEDYD